MGRHAATTGHRGPTPLFQLLDLRLDGQAREFIDSRLMAGLSLADVAFDIYDETGGPGQGMRLSPVTLSTWRRQAWWKGAVH